MRCSIMIILAGVPRILESMRLLIVLFATLCVWDTSWAFTRFFRTSGLPDPARFSVVIELGDMDLAKEWLAAGLSPDFEGSTIGTGIMIGAWEGNIPMMELFHSRGGNINKVNSNKETALQHAAWKGRITAVRWLVERGAQINREGREWSALHYAAFAGHADIVRYLLERGADVNALSTNGSSPLMMAAREGKEEVAIRLLAAGARKDIVNDAGDNAATWAMRHNNMRIAKAISGDDFPRLAARPPASFGPTIRSVAVPDRADELMAQARKLEAQGRRTEAMAMYSAALTAIKQADAKRMAAAKQDKARAVSGLTISARRANPMDQSVELSYQTPAQIGVPRVDTGDDPVAGQAARLISAEEGSGAPVTSSPANARSNVSAPIPVSREATAEAWFARARELEAAGRRKEALTAYREAAAYLRQR